MQLNHFIKTKENELLLRENALRKSGIGQGVRLLQEQGLNPAFLEFAYDEDHLQMYRNICLIKGLVDEQATKQMSIQKGCLIYGKCIHARCFNG